MKNSNVLKFSGLKETDNVETVEGLAETIKDWLETLATPFDGYSTSIEPFEFRSRDGFAAHSHNKGGFDLFTMTSISHLVGSGEHFGLKIESWVEESWNRANEAVAESDPELHAASNTDKGRDAFFDAVYEYCQDDYETVAWKVRVMYEGNGVLKVYAGFDKDAPYFREGLNDFEAEIKFRTISGLERKLKALTKKVEASQNEAKKSKKTA